MDGSDHEWELSKENVQPLRQGRHISSLVAALHSDQVEEHNIKTQQNDFELELRMYSGDDPLSVWDSYVKWTEQHFPKGGHDGQLMKLLERSLKEFQEDMRYTNDPRFIQMWIKFACLTDDPVVVYAYMFDNGIGVNVAALYIEWAISLERVGDIKRADAIYVEGLNRQAEPKHLLLQQHQQFQSRVARNITLQVAENQNPGMDMGEGTDKRSPLAKLKTSGPSHRVGALRTGNVKLGSAGSLRDSRPVPQKVGGIQVYQDDENVMPSLTPVQTNEWQSVPVRAVDNRENEKRPGVWNEAKIKQRHVTVPSVAPANSFQIHEDPANAAAETPRKTALINTQPLSSRKASQSDVLGNVRRPPASTNDTKEVSMYQKEKIYSGLLEFTFEELRAVKYWKLKKKREAEAERLRKEEEQRLNNERLQRQLLEVTEKLSQLQAQINFSNFNRSADQQAQLQTHFVQQQELANQLQSSVAAIMSECLPGTSNLQNQHGILQSSTSQGYGDNSNTNSSNSFVTPTNVMTTLNSSQVRTGDPQSGGSNSGSLKTPIFNSASTYSVDSSIRCSKPRPFQSSTSRNYTSSVPSVLSSEGNISHVKNTSTSESAPSSTGNMVSLGTDYPPAESTVSAESSLSTSGMTRSNRPTPDSKNMFSMKGALTAPSPTVYTKEALQCVMGMFSTSFSQEDHTISGEMEPPQGAVGGSGFQVPFEILEDNTGVIQTARQSLKAEKKGPQASGSEIDDKENVVKANTSVKSARRGLGFAIYDEDVDMISMDKEFQPLNSDFTIEWQARTNTTLAPLDSFIHHAKAASTPCVSAVDRSKSKMQELVDTVSTSLTSLGSSTNSCDGAPTPSKHLSPIFEGSGEGSREESKSCQQIQTANMVFPKSISHTSFESSHKDHRPEPMDADAEVDRDVSMHEDMRTDVERSRCHQIDMTTYINPQHNERTEALLSTSVCLDPNDPFDDRTVAKFLSNLKPSITEYPNFTACLGPMPNFPSDLFFSLGNSNFILEKCIGKGGYAKIYTVSLADAYETSINLDSSCSSDFAIKVQSPPCYWEFYVSCELRKRLTKLKAAMNIVPSIMEIHQGFFCEDGSVLQMTYFPRGSLLNLVNRYKDDKSLLTGVEPFACLLTIELLHMFEQIHKCGFIHGDTKPDNFLLIGLPFISEGSKNPQEVFGSHLRLVQLIDFGQSIDLTKFPKGTTFMAKVGTSGFQCIEMKTDRPWTFQTDLFGLVGTIHVVLFGSYMNVFQERGIWKVTANFVRKWNVSLWKNLFKELLNVPSCEHQPDLASLRQKFEEYFIDHLIPGYNMWVQEVNSLEIANG